MEENTTGTANNNQKDGDAKSSFAPAMVVGIVAVILVGAFFVLRVNSTKQGEDIIVEEQSGSEATETPEAGSGAEDSSNANDVDNGEMETEVKEFTVVGSNFKYDVSEIRVKKGDKVRIVFKNSNGFHDFVIDELGARTKQINTGQEETIEFTASKAGEFEFYCSVGQHRAMGMKGKFIVEE